MRTGPIHRLTLVVCLSERMSSSDELFCCRWWLVVLSTSTFALNYNDLADRSGLVSTYFLSLFAFMFVVDESLPKLDFHTRVDKIITVAVTLVASSGFASALVAASLDPPWEGDPTPMAKAINIGSAVFLLLAFLVANLCVLLPAYLKRRRTTTFITGIQSIDSSEEKLGKQVRALFGDSIGTDDSDNDDEPRCLCHCHRIKEARDDHDDLARTSALRAAVRKKDIDYWALPQTMQDERNREFGGFRSTDKGAPLQAKHPPLGHRRSGDDAQTSTKRSITQPFDGPE